MKAIFQFFIVHELRDSLVCCANVFANVLPFGSWPVVRECSVLCCYFPANIFCNLAGVERELDELVALTSLVWICILRGKNMRIVAKF